MEMISLGKGWPLPYLANLGHYNNNNNSMIIGLNPMAKAFKSAEPGSLQQTGPNGYKKGHIPYFVYM